MTVNCKGQLIDLSSPKVMGILNITPDSFYDGGSYKNEKAILNQVELMLNQGATFIDVGAYSSRPNANHVSDADELKRILPIVNLLVKSFPDILLSIDTFRSKVAQSCIEVGACMINDISAGKLDDNMLQTVADLHVPYIMMHLKGTPQTMQQQTHYDDLIKDIIFYFSERIAAAKTLGIVDIIIDPGFGFAKTLEQKYHCKGLAYLACVLAALLEERDVFSIEQARGNSDISQRVRFILSNQNGYKNRQILIQAQKLTHTVKIKSFDKGETTNLPLDDLGILVYLAYPERLLKRRNNAGDYLASYGKGVTLNINDALNNEEYLVAAHLTQFHQQLQVRLAAVVNINQLLSWQLAKLIEQERLYYDEKSARINAVKQKSIGAIILEEKPEKSLMNEEKVFAIWQEQLNKNGLKLLNWQKEDQELLLRWQWLSTTSSDNCLSTS